ncbi:hypothetical protein HZS_3863 [Henneguya salminicola]|nr:hypothetical protein HZS_3863 [Henneguya salminicola]
MAEKYNKTDRNIIITEFWVDKSNSLDFFRNKIYQDSLLDLKKAFLNIPFHIKYGQTNQFMIPSASSSKSKFDSACNYSHLSISTKTVNLSFVEEHQILIWATNGTLSVANYNSHMFMDGTFRAPPHPIINILELWVLIKEV